MIPKCKQKEYDSGWINLNNIIIYRKIDKIMIVRAFCDNKMSLKAGEYTNVGNLPNAFRPTIEIVSNWSRIGEGSVGTLKITPDGNIELYSNEATSWWCFTITFII